MRLLAQVCSLVLLSICFALLQANVEHLDVVFPVGTEKLFKYTSYIHSFGGQRTTLTNETVYDEMSKDGESSKISADVTFSSMKKWKKSNGKTVFLVHCAISNVQIDMTLDSKEEWKTVSMPLSPEEQLAQRKKLDSHFRGFTAVTLSSNGKIYKIFHEKNEEDWVTLMKKSIIAQLQVKLTGDERQEVGGVGNHTSHYTTKTFEDGKILVSKEYSDKDLLENPKNSHHREMKLQSNTDVILGKTGEVLSSVRHDYVVLGTHTKNPPKPLFSEQNVPYEEQFHWNTGKAMWLNIEETSSLEFVNQRNFSISSELEKQFINYASNEEHEEVVLSDHPTLKLHPSLVESSLEVKGLEKIASEMRKIRLQEKYDIKTLLHNLHKNPDNVAVGALIRELVALDQNALETVYALFNIQHADSKEDTESKKTNFLRLLQSILLANKSPKAQKLFLSTFVSEPLIRHGIFRTLDIENPTTEVLHKLKNFAKDILSMNANQNITSADENSMNAFLALADAIRRYQGNDSLAQELMKRMVQNFLETRNSSMSIQDIIFYLNAFGNAGSKSPLEVLSAFISHPAVRDDIKKIALFALRKRSDPKEDADVNSLINDVVLSEEFDDSLKVAAIQAQTNRQKSMKNSSSLSSVLKLLKDRKMSKMLLKSILEYCYVCDSDAFETVFYSRFPETEQEEKFDFDSILSDTGFFADIGNAFARAGGAIVDGAAATGNAIVDGAKIVGGGIVDGAKAVGNAVTGSSEEARKAFNSIRQSFAQASFQGSQVCVPASQVSTDKMCAYDAEMVHTLQSFGDLSKIAKATHFEYEKLIGTNMIHAYVGAMGYLGANFGCYGTKDEPFQFLLAGKGIVRAKIFSKTYNLIQTHLIMQRTPSGYDDIVYLSVLDVVMVNAKIIAKEQFCKTIEKKLYEKDFPSLPSLNFVVAIGPVPVSFGFSINARVQVNSFYSYCLPNLYANAGLIPSVDIGISGHGAITIFVARAGVEVSVAMNYKLIPWIGVEGLQCRSCANLDYDTKPMHVAVTAFADVNLLVFKASSEKELWKWDAKSITGTFKKQCISLKTGQLLD